MANWLRRRRLIKAGCFNKFAVVAWALLPSPAALANDVVPPAVYTVTPTGVNVSDRAFTFTNTDLSIGSLKLERFWLGGPVYDPNSTLFGKHSSHNFDIYFKQRTVNVKGPPRATYFRAIIHTGNSASGTYDIALYSNPRVVSPWQDDAFSGVLEYVNGVYVYTDQAGSVYTFDPSASVNSGASGLYKITQITHADGRVLIFSYDENKDLRLVSSSDGYAIAFDYSAHVITAACGYDTGRVAVSVSTGCGGAALKTIYTYSSGHLTGSATCLGIQPSMVSPATRYRALRHPAIPPAKSPTNTRSILTPRFFE